MDNSDNPKGIESNSNDITESDIEELGALFLNEDSPADNAKGDTDQDNVEDDLEDNTDTDEDQEDDDETDIEQDEDTDEEVDLNFATDDTIVKLDDGTQVTVKDLRLGNLRDADYRRKTMDLSEERKAFGERETQLQAIEQRTAQERQWMEQALQASMPERPDPAMMDTDPIGYMQAKERYDQFAGQFQHLQQQQNAAMVEAQQKQKNEHDSYLRHEMEALVEANPEFRDQSKLKEFWNEASDTFASNYGFSQQDLQGITDHRLVKVIRNAMAYDKLKAAAPKTKKAIAGKPQVLKSAPRKGNKSARAKAVHDRISQAQKSGNTKGISDILGHLIIGE